MGQSLPAKQPFCKRILLNSLMPAAAAIGYHQFG
jgi:hypothetical protein